MPSHNRFIPYDDYDVEEDHEDYSYYADDEDFGEFSGSGGNNYLHTTNNVLLTCHVCP